MLQCSGAVAINICAVYLIICLICLWLVEFLFLDSDPDPHPQSPLIPDPNIILYQVDIIPLMWIRINRPFDSDIIRYL